MAIEVGRVRELFRYPVKSMAPVAIESTLLGWHGFNGDRRFAFRRTTDNNGFPWLTASRLPSLLLYQPFGHDANATEPSPTHVRTPEGVDFELRGEELRADIAHRFGSDVELMKLNHGIFDAASISVITLATILGIERGAGTKLDIRRFRPNIVLETHESQPFNEDNWIGGTLIFGESESGAVVNVTIRDERCMMINLDPDTAKQEPAVMKAVVRMNQNNAGVYGTVVREGTISVGQRVKLILTSDR
jgi:uncharacterized protein YcbX